MRKKHSEASSSSGSQPNIKNQDKPTTTSRTRTLRKQTQQNASASRREGQWRRTQAYEGFYNDSISSRTRAQTKNKVTAADNSSRQSQKREQEGQRQKKKKTSRSVSSNANPTPSTSGTSSSTRPHSLHRACSRPELDTPDVSLNDAFEEDPHSNRHVINRIKEDDDDYVNRKLVDSDDYVEDSDTDVYEVHAESSGDEGKGVGRGAKDKCCCTSSWGCGGRLAPLLEHDQRVRNQRVGQKRHHSPYDDDVSPTKKSHPSHKNRHNGSSGQNMVSQQSDSNPTLSPALDQWLNIFQQWSPSEKRMALDSLIADCDVPHVRYMMEVIEPHFQRDFISLLPKELALYVLSFLEPRDILRAAQTCRYWHILCEDGLLWREKCREEGISEMLVFGSRVRWKLGPRSPCKRLLLRQSQIEHNWRKGKLKSPLVLRAHDEHVVTCLEFCGDKIISGSDDNTLKVWSAITGRCTKNLIGHTGGVWSSQMTGNTVISGSTDRSLKVWNADTGVCKHTLYGHSSTVRCLSLSGKKVVSGSRDATLRVWDIESGHCLNVLLGHMAAVRCVQYDGKRVVSGAYDYTVRVWDPDTASCLHTLQGHSNRVYSLQFDGVYVVSGSLDTSIRVWDVTSGKIVHTLMGHQSLTSGLELKDNLLVSGNADSTVKVWDVHTGKCLQTLLGPNKHRSAVTCLQFNKKFVVTCSDDGTVKLWDLKTGDFVRNLITLPSGGSGGVVWRLRCNNTKMVCAVGSRNGTEETKLLVLDFDQVEREVEL